MEYLGHWMADQGWTYASGTVGHVRFEPKGKLPRKEPITRPSWRRRWLEVEVAEGFDIFCIYPWNCVRPRMLGPQFQRRKRKLLETYYRFRGQVNGGLQYNAISRYITWKVFYYIFFIPNSAKKRPPFTCVVNKQFSQCGEISYFFMYFCPHSSFFQELHGRKPHATSALW